MKKVVLTGLVAAGAFAAGIFFRDIDDYRDETGLRGWIAALRDWDKSGPQVVIRTPPGTTVEQGRIFEDQKTVEIMPPGGGRTTFVERLNGLRYGVRS